MPGLSGIKKTKNRKGVPLAKGREDEGRKNGICSRFIFASEGKTIERENFTFRFPLATCLIISILLTLLVNFFRK